MRRTHNAISRAHMQEAQCIRSFEDRVGRSVLASLSGVSVASTADLSFERTDSVLAYRGARSQAPPEL